MFGWFRNRSPQPEPAVSDFEMTIAALLIRDGARQEQDSKVPPAPPPKPIGLRKVLSDLN
jgi:hypothetical protein